MNNEFFGQTLPLSLTNNNYVADYQIELLLFKS